MMLAPLLLLATLPQARAQSDPIVLPLWPTDPAAEAPATAEIPTISVYLPPPSADGSQGSRSAVVICPGGGYGHLAMEKEGHEVARWFARSGVAGVVLKYRLPNAAGREAPLQDARRALQMVREDSEQWRVDPSRLGIMGFSAGGHLAAAASVQLTEGGPNFSILIYPVISMDAAVTHGGSRRNLLGDEPDEDLLRRYSSELQVDGQTPPAFLVHTSDDPVKVQNSLLYYSALQSAGVAAELHIFSHGGHGYGMRRPDLPVGVWPQLLTAWMQDRGYAEPEKKEG